MPENGWMNPSLLAIMTEPTLSKLSDTYLTALRTHLEQDSKTGMQEAQAFGEEAAIQGLETLELAKIHDQALAELVLPDQSTSKREMRIKRASLFFAEANRPIEETHKIALKAKGLINQAEEALAVGTLELSKSKCLVKRGIAERKLAVNSLKISEEESAKLLKEAHILERHLRTIYQKILAEDEDERKKTSLRLNDEIAQTLLGIQVRMQVLKNEVAVHDAALSKEMATTQQLVDESVGFITPFFHESDTQNKD